MIRRTLVLASTALGMAMPACKGSEPAPDPAPAPSQDAAEAEAEQEPPEPQTPEAAPTVADPPVEYAMELAPLLDLVPGKDEHFIATRDPAAVLRLFDAFVGVATPTVLERLDAEISVAEARAVFEQATKLREALIEAKVDLDKGMLFLEEPGVLVYGTASEDPTAIKVALKAVGVEESNLPPTCVAPEAMPGYAACGDDEAALKALVPGKHGEAYRAAFDERLAGFGADRSNVLFRLDGPQGPVLGAVATPPGRLHLAVGMADVGKELGDYLAGGRPESLGLLGPGGAFVWGRLKLAAFEQQVASAPPPVRNVVDTLTGEFLVGGIEGAAGGMLLGVDDPFPASGLVSLAGMQSDMILVQLPEGSTAKVEPVEVAGAKTPALHVKVAFDGKLAQVVEVLDLEPSAWGFSAGNYAGAILGAGSETVAAVGEHVPEAGAPAGLPSNLAAALATDDAAVAVHLPLDALQAATVRDTLSEAMVASEGVMKGQPELVEAVYDVVSPLSSLSVWLTHPEQQRVLHVSLEAFGDASTQEGKDALEALGKVVSGADPAQTYGALAARYASSPRAERYQLRAGPKEGSAARSAVSTSFLMGVVAGITVPAFNKYIERSKAAQEELSAAEQALLQAEEAIERP